jgi:protoporphyrinogen oxidase
MHVGHRLRARQTATVERVSGPVRRIGTAIVGAGPSGLSAAWRFDRLGEHDYLIFELEAQPGGTSAYGRDGVVPYPWGAHYVPVPSGENRALVALLDELAVIERDARGQIVGKERFVVREPQERIFVNGAWHEGLVPATLLGPADREDMARFNGEIERWARFRDGRGRRAFALPMEHSSTDAQLTALDRISAARWLREQDFRSKLLEWYVAYACRDDYGLLPEHTSAWAMLFYFAARRAQPGRDDTQFLTWPEGNGHLVEHLARSAGSRLRTGQLVTDVVPRADGVELCALDVKSGKIAKYRAEHAILALPKFVLPHVLEPFREAPPDYLRAFSYSPWLVANIHLSKRPSSVGAELAWDNVIYDSPALGYVVATHQVPRDSGRSVFTYYKPFLDPDPDAARRRLASLEHAEFVRSIIDDLAPAHEDFVDCIERVDVWRWGHAMIRPVPGFIWGSARKQACIPLGRVHFAHSDLSGLALFEEAQYRGVVAAEAILRERGREFEPLAG